MNDRPLLGRTIVVTRAVTQAAPLVDAIVARGGDAVELPLLEINDAADGGAAMHASLAALSIGDWLVVLSPNGSRRVVDHVAPGICSLAVIGSGTARPFEDAGWRIEMIPDESTAEGLARSFEPLAVTGRVLIAQAEGGRTVLADALRARGIEVEVVTAYRNQVPTVDVDAVRAARTADIVVFASPSAVYRYLEEVGVNPKLAVCIGSVTSAAAEDAGFDVRVAQAPSLDALIEAVESAQLG